MARRVFCLEMFEQQVEAGDVVCRSPCNASLEMKNFSGPFHSADMPPQQLLDGFHFRRCLDLGALTKLLYSEHLVRLF